MKIQITRTRSLLSGVALAALAAVPLAHADYSSTVVGQGPVGYWRLNETTQPPTSIAAVNEGSLGASANGTFNNYPTFGLTGPFAGSVAVGLDGSSETITTPYQSGLNPNTFSFEIWANPAQVPYFAYLASSVDTTSPRSGWYLAQDNSSTFGLGYGFVVRMFYQNGNTPAITLFATNDLPLGTWYHLVLTYDGTTATLYKNGAVADSGTPAGYVPDDNAQTSVGYRSDGNFYWPGEVAQVAMYNGALSATEVAKHYTTATTTPASYSSVVKADAPLLYWEFNSGTPPVAANLGTLGTAANGVYLSPVKAGSAGPSSPTYPGFESANKSAYFDGTGGVIRVPALNLDTNTVTISAWVNAVGQQAVGAGIVLCDSAPTYSGLTMDQAYGGLGLGYIWNGDNYGWSPNSDSGLPPLPDSGWAFVALVVQPDQAALYVCDANNFADFTSVTNSGLSQPVQAFGGPTLFGADAGSTSSYFFGSIDEVAIFNRALGAGELYTEYATAVGGVPPKVFTDLQGPSGSVAAGDPIVLTIDAGGTAPLTYTWTKGGTTVATGTTGTFTISSSAITDGGSYQVKVANSSGTVTSQSVTVSVVTPSLPAIVSADGFVARTLYPGASLNMDVVATGGGLKYQWYKDSVALASATASAFSIGSLGTTNAGSYLVVVTNALGSVTNGPVAITVPAVVAGTYEAAIIASTPEAWWRLGEAAGTTNLWDSMGRHDGYYTNLQGKTPPVVLGATGALSGDSDTAASFTTAYEGIGFIPYSQNLNSTPYSIEGWVKTSSASADGIVPFSNYFDSKGCWAQAVAGWWWGENSSGTFGNDNNVNTLAQVDAGQWSYIVLIYNPVTYPSYPWQLYVNGATDGYVWGGGSGANAAGPFIIGARGVGDALVADSFFNGQVDEVAVYKHTLTGTEITAHFNARFGNAVAPYFSSSFLPQTVTAGKDLSYSTAVLGSVPIGLQWYKSGTAISGATTTILSLTNLTVSETGTYSLVASNIAGMSTQSVPVTVIAPVGYANVTNDLVLHLRFDGDLTDSSGQGNNGTAVGSPGFVTGIIGAQALQYDTVVTTNGTTQVFSSADYVTLGRPNDLLFGSADSFSVSLWVKLASGYLDGDLPFIGTETNSDNNPGWVMSPSYEAGGWEFDLDDGTDNIDVNGAGNSINDGAWHNYVLTVDRTAALASAYLDGVLMATRDISSLGSLDNGGGIVIGQDPTGTYPERGTAALDDLGIWRRALTALEVAEIQSAGSTAGHSFDTVSQNVTLTLSRSGSSVTLTWSTGTLQQSASLGATASWSNVTGAAAPSYTFTPGTGNMFFRVKVQ